MPKLLINKKILNTRIKRSKIFLITALFIFFLPLIILPFYNHPFADDYFCGYYLSNKGFLPYQVYIYKNWGGRFAATFAGSLFAYHNFLYQHYYVYSLLLLILNFISTFFLINIICKKILNTEYKLSSRLLFTFLFVALEICSVPQPSTFLFWFSSAITYNLPVTFIQLEIALLILLNNTDKRLVRIACSTLLPILICLTVGFNELFIIVQLFILIIIVWIKWYKKFPGIFILCVLGLIAASAVVLFAPGNQIRAHEITSKSFFTGVTACLYHCTETTWFIFKNPFFWFAAMILFICGNQEQWQQNRFIQKLLIKKWRFGFLIFLFLIASITVPVAALKGGIIPDRYVNAVVCFMLMLLMPFFFIAGINNKSTFISFQSNAKKSIACVLIAIGLLCNSYVIDAYKSLLIAPVYNAVLNEREAALQQASSGNKIAIVTTYDVALSKLIQTKYSTYSVTFQQLIQQKPPLLFFEDDLATEPSILVLKNYYKLDSIIVRKN